MAETKVANNIKNVVAKGKISYSSMKEETAYKNDGDIVIGGLIGSASAVRLSSAYSEMELSIIAMIKSEKNLYSSLVFGRGYDSHTELANTIVNGKIAYDTTGSDDGVSPEVHNYDGSTFVDSNHEKKSMAVIDNETVKYVIIEINGTPSQEIDITDAITYAKWDLSVWSVTVDETNNKLIVKF